MYRRGAGGVGGLGRPPAAAAGRGRESGPLVGRPRLGPHQLLPAAGREGRRQGPARPRTAPLSGRLSVFHVLRNGNPSSVVGFDWPFPRSRAVAAWNRTTSGRSTTSCGRPTPATPTPWPSSAKCTSKVSWPENGRRFPILRGRDPLEEVAFTGHGGIRLKLGPLKPWGFPIGGSRPPKGVVDM